MLRAWEDNPRILVNWRKAECIRLGEEAFYVLSCCDGVNDFDSPAFLPVHRKLLQSFVKEGVAVPCTRRGGRPGTVCRKTDSKFVMGALWTLTGRCNMKCRHCYMGAPNGELPELDWQEIMAILTELEKSNVLCVAVTGGEPLVRKDFLLFVEELVRRKICLSDIYTNGTLVTGHFLQRLGELGVHPVFRVSFDGVNAHENMRGVKGSEAQTMHAIRKIVDAGFRVSVGTCVDENCLLTLEETYRCMKELGVSSWGIARPQPMGCGKGLSRVDTDRFIDKCEKIMELWLKDACPFQLGLEAFYAGTAETVGRESISELDVRGFSCSSCQKWPYISENGTLMPCPSYCDTEYALSLPNLTACSWKEAWEHPCWQELISVKRTQIYEKEESCRECQYFNKCGGGCRVAAVLGGNGLYGKDPMICEVWKRKGKQRFIELAKNG